MRKCHICGSPLSRGKNVNEDGEVEYYEYCDNCGADFS
jgi:hypothetical protein